MDLIRNVTIRPCSDSKYIRPRRVHYNQDGVDKIWDAMKVHDGKVTTEMKDGVECVDTDKYPGSLGVTIEVCAGIIDKDVPVAEIAKMEVLEECGYDVPLENIRKITSCRGGVGTSGATLYLYYAEVTDEMKKTAGGGLVEEGELIDVLEVAVDDGRKLIYDESVNRASSLLFTLLWFFTDVWNPKMKL